MYSWNKSFRLALLLTALTVWNASATVTIGVGAATLQTSNGAAMPTTGLVMLVASTNGTQFGGPTPTSFVSQGNVEVARWNLSGTATAGQFSDTFGPAAIPAGLSSGNALALYWFPTLTVGAAAPGAGTTYGVYRDTVGTFGNYGSGLDNSDPWFIPADGASVGIYFATTDAGGSVNPTNGLAAYVVDNPPVANPAVFGRAASLGLKINIADLLTNVTDADLDPITLTGVNLTTTNNVTLTTNSTQIFYPAAAPNVNDQFTYTVTDGHPGVSVTGSVQIQIISVTGTSSIVSIQGSFPTAGQSTIQFAGVPGLQYVAQFTTNVVNGPWLPFSTNTAGTNGLWSVVDTNAVSPTRFYRVKY